MVGLRPELELVIKANNVEIHNQNDVRTNVTKVEVTKLLEISLSKKVLLKGKYFQRFLA